MKCDGYVWERVLLEKSTYQILTFFFFLKGSLWDAAKFQLPSLPMIGLKVLLVVCLGVVGCGVVLSRINVMKDTTNADMENDGEKTSSFKLYYDFELLCFFYVYFLIIN